MGCNYLDKQFITAFELKIYEYLKNLKVLEETIEEMKKLQNDY